METKRTETSAFFGKPNRNIVVGLNGFGKLFCENNDFGICWETKLKSGVLSIIGGGVLNNRTIPTINILIIVFLVNDYRVLITYGNLVNSSL